MCVCVYDSSSFPFQFTLQLLSSATADNDSSSKNVSNSYLTLKLEPGYPVTSGVQISNYRTVNAKDKARLEAVVRAVRKVSSECQEEEMEGCIACCAIALETWSDHNLFQHENKNHDDSTTDYSDDNKNNNDKVTTTTANRIYKWISGEPLLDKKSSFQAHVCEVHSEQEVREALHQLLTSSSKIQRASHNMYAWRIAETIMSDDDDDDDDNNNTNNKNNRRVFIKHDNDDDGEDAAGNKMAFLLDMRKDENVLVVVSRWFGGIHLGPKRFAHIVNVSRKLLVEYTAAAGGSGSGSGSGGDNGSSNGNNKNAKNK